MTASPTAEPARYNRELSILNAIAGALNRQVDLRQALQTTLAQVADLFGLETGWVWLMRDDHSAYLAAAQNLPRPFVDEPARMEGSCYCLDAFLAGEMDHDARVITCTRLKHIVAIADGLRYHASIPLFAQGEGTQRRRLGVLNVASAEQRELTADDLRLLHTIGDMAGIAVERAQLFERSAALGALEERNRLAREIHDTLAQGLAAITMQLEAADALVEGGRTAQARAAIQRALRLARANLEEARRSVLDLRAAPLEGRTLREALLALLKEHGAHWQIEARFDGAAAQQPLPARVETALYRIAQEALANAARHARARRVALHLTIALDQAAMIVEDDGVGFDPSQSPPDRCGLIGMRERARLAGGTFEVRSSPGAGTRVAVKLPLDVADSDTHRR
ncbi:MAG: GAF domain-containing sensor histidine kinase [Anaerolineae bacterium]|nr:GAF domain-containing sensor histidine kinase [Candidatus Roseilinea sp.]MDW8449429.1 GAF domain-containing sensor histidine kinase [Anaerolineae bacterium]